MRRPGSPGGKRPASFSTRWRNWCSSAWSTPRRWSGKAAWPPAVAKMCFGNRIGFAFNQDVDRRTLFAPLAGSLVLELREGDMCLEGLSYTLVGTTIDRPEIVLDGEALELDDLAEIWMSPLESVFPNRPADRADMPVRVPLYTARTGRAPAVKAAVPRVFIPVFPGTNCEYDTARAFERRAPRPRCWWSKT